MTKLTVLMGVLLALSACAPADNPTLNSNDSQLFSTTKDVIVRGISGPNGLRQPILVTRTYPILCARDPLMEPPAIRAKTAAREINRLVGPVTDRAGESYFKAQEMRQINAVLVPSLKCQVGQFTERQTSRDPNVIAAFAAKQGIVLGSPMGGL